MRRRMDPVASCLVIIVGLSGALQANALDSLQVRTGALYLHRSDNNDDVLVRDSSLQPLLTASQASPGGDVGWELALIGRFRKEFAIELRYFQLDNFSFDTQLTSSPSGLGFAVDDSVIGFSGSSNPIVGRIDYESALYNIELNERWRISPNVEFILGLRHIQNKEGLRGVFTDDSTGSNTIQFDADNYLTGIQVGLDAVLMRRGRFQLEGMARLGAYHNIIRTRYDMFLDTNIGSAREWAAERDNGFSLAGELQLTGAYRISDRISLRGGYHLLFLTDVATAPNQVTSTDSSFVNPATPRVAVFPTASDSPLYQGIFAQLEFWLYK